MMSGYRAIDGRALGVLVAILATVAGGAIAQDNQINNPNNPGTVNVAAGQTVRSSNATPAITLNGGTINNSGNVLNTQFGQRAILTSNGTTINNFAGANIQGLIQMGGTGTVANVVNNSGVINGTDGTAITMSDSKDDTVNLNGGSRTVGDINMGDGRFITSLHPQSFPGEHDTLNFDGDGGVFIGNAIGVEIINKTSAGTFTWSGNATEALALNVNGGTLNFTKQAGGNGVHIDNAATTINGGGQLLVGDGATFTSSALTANGAGSNLAVGAGGTVNANGATKFNAGTSFSVAQGGTFNVQNLAMDTATGVVAGRTAVSNSLSMTNSNVRVTATGVFSAAGTSTFTNSFISVDSGGDFAGDVTYDNTLVTVNGKQDGNITLGAGSTLKGTGTINGNVVIGAGATLAPGNSPGTITIGKNLTLDNLSTTQIEISNLASDLINVGGIATLGGKLQIIPLDSVRAGRTITIINAPNSPIVGNFGTVVAPSTPVINFATKKNVNTFDIVITRNAYAPLTLSVNQQGPAAFLDRYLATPLTQLDPLTLALDSQTSQSALVGAFEQLHAEPFDAHAQIAVQDQQQFAGHIEQYLATARLNLDRPAGPVAVTQTAPAGMLSLIAPSALSASMVPDPGVRHTDNFRDPDNLWGGFGYYYDYEGRNDTRLDAAGQVQRTGFDYGHRGAMGGVDRHVGKNGIVGVAFASGDIHADFRGGRGRIDADTYDLGVYGTWACKNGMYADALVNYTNYDFKTLRTVIFPGFADADRSTQRAHSISGYVGAGWMHPTGEWSWGPTASLQYTGVDLNGFTEVGGTSALTVNQRNVDSLRSQLGLRATRQYEVHENYSFMPELRLRWAHEFANDDRAITASFAGTGAAIGPFTSFADRIDRDSAYLGGTINAFFKKSLSAFVSYDWDIGRADSRVDAGRFGLAFKF